MQICNTAVLSVKPLSSDQGGIQTHDKPGLGNLCSIQLSYLAIQNPSAYHKRMGKQSNPRKIPNK